MDLLVWSRRGPVDPLLWRSLRTRILSGGWRSPKIWGPSRAACPGDSGWRRPGSGTLGDGASWGPEDPVGGRSPSPSGDAAPPPVPSPWRCGYFGCH